MNEKEKENLGKLNKKIKLAIEKQDFGFFTF